MTRLSAIAARALPCVLMAALVVPLSVVPFPGSAQSPNPTRGAEPLSAPVVIPLTRGPGHLRTIRVRVGQDSAAYLFDTGGGVDVISPQDSATLGCTPGGLGFGVRLTGEALSSRTCANVTLGVGPLEVTDDRGVMDLAKMLGPRAPAVRGQISLKSFAGQLLTVDLAHDRLILETPASAAERVRGMTPVRMRLATGEGGGQLTPYVGIRAPNGAVLWLEWDSENNASTLIAPYALAMLGGDSTARGGDVKLPLAKELDVMAPVMVKKDMIHDGVLSAAFLERAVWTLDLQQGRMWVGPVAPLLSMPAASASVVTPPDKDPVGIYESTAQVGGHPQGAVIEIARVNGTLVGHLRPAGEEQVFELRNVQMTGNVLSYQVPVQNPIDTRVTFNGLEGSGIWGDGGVKRGGKVTVVKRG